jgi:hypothetical protein
LFDIFFLAGILLNFFPSKKHELYKVAVSEINYRELMNTLENNEEG